MVDIANFVTNGQFGGVDLPRVDALRRQNALGQLDLAQAQRQNAALSNPSTTPEQFTRAGLPQIANSLDAQQQFTEAQKATAAAVLAQRFAAIARSPQPKLAAAQFIQSPEFQKGAQLVGLNPAQYTVTNQDTDQSIAQQAAQHAAFLGFRPDEYTLGKDQVRIRDGQTIASGPPDAEAAQRIQIEQQRLAETKRHNQATETNQAVDPASVENTAQMIASGRMPMLSGFSLKTPWGQQVVSRVNEIAPDYQGGAYNAKAATMRQFASGQQGNTVRSLNVAISHLGTLNDLANALGNKDTQLYNKAVNTWKTQTGQSAPTSFSAARDIVANEVVKAVTASGGGVADRQEAQNQIQAASSPAQLAGVIGTWTKLLSGQLGGLRQQYEQGTGQTDFQRFLSPETIAKLEPSGGNAAQSSAFATEAEADAAAKAGKIKSGDRITVNGVSGTWQ